MGRLLATLQTMWARATATPQATRVGLLNTGELVLVDSFGHAQILGAQTTDVVRDTLAAAECSTTQLLGDHLLGGIAPATGPRPADHVHGAIHSLRRAP